MAMNAATDPLDHPLRSPHERAWDVPRRLRTCHNSGAAISSVNWSEVVQKSLARGAQVAGLREDLEAAGLIVLPFEAEDADLAARLWFQTRSYGLSLGDRACLATGLRARAPVLTADHTWTSLTLDVDVRSIR